MHKDALHGLSRLTRLKLYETGLETLPKDLFSAEKSNGKGIKVHTPKLQVLVAQKNRFRCLPKDLFRGLSQLDTVVLFDNELETVSAGLLEPLTGLTTLHLAKNPLVCDCRLEGLISFLKDKDVEKSGAFCTGRVGS